MAQPGPDGTAPRGELWIVNHYADAPDRASGTRHFDLARRLVGLGYPVTIFAAGFSHVTGREERLTGGRLYRTQEFDGVRFVWLRTTPYRGNTWRRSANMLSFALALLVVQTRLPPPATVIGSTVHPFAALSAWLMAKLRGARYLFEVRDLWPQTLVDLGAMRVGSPGERGLRAIEAFLVRRAAAVITLLPGMCDYLEERGLPTDRVVYIPNGVDVAAFNSSVGADADPSPALRPALDAIARRRAEGRVVVGYIGAFGRVNDLATIITAASIVEARSPGRVAVVLVGDGPERPDVERLAAEAGIVDVVPSVPKGLVPAIVRAIDVGLVHATASATYRYGISFNKLFDYFAAARPVVFACESSYDPVATAGAGISLPPGDPARMADSFLELALAGDADREARGLAGRAYLERHHDVAILAGALATVLAEP